MKSEEVMVVFMDTFHCDSQFSVDKWHLVDI